MMLQSVLSLETFVFVLARLFRFTILRVPRVTR